MICDALCLTACRFWCLIRPLSAYRRLGGIGRRARLKIEFFGVWVRVPQPVRSTGREGGALALPSLCFWSCAYGPVHSERGGFRAACARVFGCSGVRVFGVLSGCRRARAAARENALPRWAAGRCDGVMSSPVRQMKSLALKTGRVPMMSRATAQRVMMKPVTTGSFRASSPGSGFSQYIARMILK